MKTKVNNMIDKILKYTILAIFGAPIVLFLLIYASCWIFPEAWGSYNLGNNLYMIYGEKDSKYIVFSNELEGRVSHGGWNIIPSSGTMFDSEGHFHEWVTSAKSNSNWIIAKTCIAEKDKKFYIISKDFNYKELKKLYKEISKDSLKYIKFEEAIERLKKNYIFSYNDSNRFINECKNRDIPLRFD